MLEPSVTFLAQGQVFKLRVEGQPQKGGGLRGVIIGFSLNSRKRLLEDVAKLDCRKALPLFLTMTYPAEFPDCSTAKRHLRAFRKRLMRRYPGLALIWRIELQKRGAPHFHCLLWGCPFLPVADIRAMWADVIGYTGGDRLQVSVEKIRSWRGVMAYVGKYIAKVTRGAAPPVGAGGGTVGAGSEVSLTVSHICPQASEAVDTDGRVWGVVNKESLPWAELVSFRAPWGRWFHAVKRMARRAVQKDNGGNLPGWFNALPWMGCTLFRDNPYQWFEAVGTTWAEGVA